MLTVILRPTPTVLQPKPPIAFNRLEIKAGFREAADKAFAVARNLQMTFEAWISQDGLIKRCVLFSVGEQLNPGPQP